MVFWESSENQFGRPKKKGRQSFINVFEKFAALPLREIPRRYSKSVEQFSEIFLISKKIWPKCCQTESKTKQSNANSWQSET